MGQSHVCTFIWKESAAEAGEVHYLFNNGALLGFYIFSNDCYKTHFFRFGPTYKEQGSFKHIFFGLFFLSGFAKDKQLVG